MPAKNRNTKFPVARIKKIMQKDEEVGKVAQGTPVVISKALELFLAVIVDEASKVTIERGARKVEAHHLKSAVESTEMLDFLKEIVQGVPDPIEKPSKPIKAPRGDSGDGRKRAPRKSKTAVKDEEQTTPVSKEEDEDENVSESDPQDDNDMDYHNGE